MQVVVFSNLGFFAEQLFHVSFRGPIKPIKALKSIELRNQIDCNDDSIKWKILKKARAATGVDEQVNKAKEK